MTTGTASPFAALQGTTAWIGWLRIAGEPSWPTGWALVTQPVLLIMSTLPAVIGLAGLASRRMPEATWLRLSLVVGLVLLTLGFVGPAQGPFAGALRSLLDGPLAAARNIHKFEQVVRIPLLLGMVHAAGSVRLTRSPRLALVPRELLAVVVALLTVAAAAPAAAGMLTRSGGYAQLPDYWRDTARWLDAQPGPGSVLVVPAAPFAELTWGSTRDEPLQALMQRPFAVRDAVPLGTAGTTRLLDEVERDLVQGTGSPALRQTLADAGIRYLVVRNDLSISARTAEPLAVHQALDRSGIERVASFGPVTGSAVESPTLTVDERTLQPVPSVEVYETGVVTGSRLVPVSDLRTLTGGPEDLPAVRSMLPTGGAAVLAGDSRALPALPEVLSDGNQRREVAFGRASDNRSPVLTAADPGRTGRRVIDYLVAPQTGQAGQTGQTVLRWEGVADVTASSSASDADATLHRPAGYGPAAALDGDPGTRWVSGRYGQALGEWLQVDLTGPTDLAATGVTIDLSGTSPVEADPARVRVTTDTGSVSTDVPGLGRPFALRVPPGTTQHLRVTLEATRSGVKSGFSINELVIPGVRAVPRLVLPAPATPAPEAISLRTQQPGATGCLQLGGRPLCADRLVRPSEEAAGLYRAFTTRADASYSWTGEARVRGSAAAARLLDQPGRVLATASSQRVPSVAARPGAAVDADLGTAWVAAADDPRPTLHLTLPARRVITGVQLLLDQYVSASRAGSVDVRTSDGRTRTVPVDQYGHARFTATTTSLDLTLHVGTPTRSVDALTGYTDDQPVGVSEVRLIGADDLRRPLDRKAPVAASCGSGPTLTIDGTTQRTRLVATTAQVLAEQPVRWLPCGETASAATPLTLAPGEHRVSADATEAFAPTSLLLRTTSASSAPHVSASAAPAAVLVLDHNVNAGWAATDGAGRPLTPVRVNGWQQGFVVPDGDATHVTTRFTPQEPYAWLLGLGLVALVGLAVGAVVSAGADRHRPHGAAPADPAIAPADGWAARLLPAGVAVVLLPLAFGWTGVLALVLAAAAALAAVRRPQVARYRPLVVGVLGLVAVALVSAQPWAQGGAALSSWPVQALVLAAVALAQPVDDPTA
ncbi:hypothetical protein GCM10025862_17160 [Arsenicicoccus piscis]|uniref:F5/8 type C domain-containing protein n=1 Tax=Arsenicicoccus piscis TaxID=673954 RepID=A0ABQ6HQ41_9MICO|nr:alpha-(1->3)-arabinofuranosyltransferase family protein [Arsenicicoccus piscis]GMA19695.1 hypothetical protein GCM10025862_17160 [Arsenicicoccus piscis]